MSSLSWVQTVCQPLFWWSKTVCAILVEGIMRNISVKLFKIWKIWLRRRCHLKTFLIMSSGNPCIKVSMGAKIRNRYNQVPHLTQDTNGKVTNSQPDTTNESQEVSPFSAGDHTAHINRGAQRHSKRKTEKT